MDDAVANEVGSLHEFFERWLGGRCQPGASAFRRLTDVLADEFLLITPDGTAQTRDELIESLQPAYGARGTAFQLRVRNFASRELAPGLHLAVYEEWQQRDGRANARMSSALLRAHEDAPHGLEWVHVHETWLPEEGA